MRIPGMWRIKNKWTDLEMYFLSKKMHLNQEDNILIFTEPRSGSTWLAEILHEITKKPILWEPLHLEKGKIFSDLGFSWRQHIPENAEWPEAHQTFTDLFTGNILNNWITIQTNAESLKNADSAIIKFVRANALLPWLLQNFKFKYKPIYLIRNPFAVVSSQIQKGWNYNVDKLYDTKLKYNDYWFRNLDYLKSLKTNEEGLMAFWCLSNKPALESEIRDVEFVTICYEDLVMNPQITLAKLLNDLNLQFDLSSIDFEKPSFTVAQGSPLKGKAQTDIWKLNLTKAQISKMEAVLIYFGIIEYDCR